MYQPVYLITTLPYHMSNLPTYICCLINRKATLTSWKLSTIFKNRPHIKLGRDMQHNQSKVSSSVPRIDITNGSVKVKCIEVQRSTTIGIPRSDFENWIRYSFASWTSRAAAILVSHTLKKKNTVLYRYSAKSLNILRKLWILNGFVHKKAVFMWFLLRVSSLWYVD